LPGRRVRDITSDANYRLAPHASHDMTGSFEKPARPRDSMSPWNDRSNSIELAADAVINADSETRTSS
jgi:hypothetical protein